MGHRRVIAALRSRPAVKGHVMAVAEDAILTGLISAVWFEAGGSRWHR
jgi:hypothetical protein